MQLRHRYQDAVEGRLIHQSIYGHRFRVGQIRLEMLLTREGPEAIVDNPRTFGGAEGENRTHTSVMLTGV